MQRRGASRGVRNSSKVVLHGVCMQQQSWDGRGLGSSRGWGAAEDGCRGLPIRHGQDLIVYSGLLSSLEDVFLRCSQSAIQYVVIYCVIEQWQVLQ